MGFGSFYRTTLSCIQGILMVQVLYSVITTDSAQGPYVVLEINLVQLCARQAPYTL